MGLVAIGAAAILAPELSIADTLPGDACTAANATGLSGGTTTSGVVHLLVCNGATWQQLMTWSGGKVGVGNTDPASRLVVAPPTSQTIAAGGTIAADACGTIKPVTAAAAVTTNTTNTFTSPTAQHAGCCMDVINVGANNITLDANAKFKTIAAANQVIGAADAVRVCSNGTNWYQVGAVSGNQ